MDLINRPAQGREPALAFARIAVPGLCRLERPNVDHLCVVANHGRPPRRPLEGNDGRAGPGCGRAAGSGRE